MVPETPSHLWPANIWDVTHLCPFPVPSHLRTPDLVVICGRKGKRRQESKKVVAVPARLSDIHMPLNGRKGNSSRVTNVMAGTQRGKKKLNQENAEKKIREEEKGRSRVRGQKKAACRRGHVSVTRIPMSRVHYAIPNGMNCYDLLLRRIIVILLNYLFAVIVRSPGLLSMVLVMYST
jgi:hypothetical protein